MTGKGAAFFDLDRTLLSGASGEVFSAAMKAAGLVNRSVPGEAMLFRVFNTIGETCPSMALARQAVAMAKGKSREAVCAAAETVAEQLLDMVQPGAIPLFDEHRAAGRPVVMATTTPYDLVKPLADLLGLDDVIATGIGSTTTAPTTGRSTVRSCGAPASSPPYSSGRRTETSTWPPATRTATACTTSRCSPRSAIRSSSIRIRGWR
jgi:putative phosphoserine phosphatase/1-acylglycerol-3-phosphate O-acyltransferase